MIRVAALQRCRKTRRAGLGVLQLCNSVTLLTVLLASCSTDPGGTGYLAVMSGNGMNPPLETSSAGTVSFRFTNDVLSYDVILQFTSNVTMAHIHSGAAGTDGPVVVTLYGGPTTGLVNGRLSSGDIRAADLTTLSMDSLLVLMHGGNAYADVHTTNHSGGEIRGQIYIN